MFKHTNRQIDENIQSIQNIQINGFFTKPLKADGWTDSGQFILKRYDLPTTIAVINY